LDPENPLKLELKANTIKTAPAKRTFKNRPVASRDSMLNADPSGDAQANAPATKSAPPVKTIERPFCSRRPSSTNSRTTATAVSKSSGRIKESDVIMGGC
jgi:hypothetical protein